MQKIFLFLSLTTFLSGCIFFGKDDDIDISPQQVEFSISYSGASEGVIFTQKILYLKISGEAYSNELLFFYGRDAGGVPSLFASQKEKMTLDPGIYSVSGYLDWGYGDENNYPVIQEKNFTVDGQSSNLVIVELIDAVPPTTPGSIMGQVETKVSGKGQHHVYGRISNLGEYPPEWSQLTSSPKDLSKQTQTFTVASLSSRKNYLLDFFWDLNDNRQGDAGEPFFAEPVYSFPGLPNTVIAQVK